MSLRSLRSFRSLLLFPLARKKILFITIFFEYCLQETRMRIGVIGLNHKLADLKLREKLAKACHLHFSMGQNRHQQHYFVLLSTCNRTEIYFTSEELAEAHSYLLSLLRMEIQDNFDQKMYSYFSYDCFLHLCRVTVGLDSAIIAETEIQGQVKTAYENAIQYTQLPYELHYLFQNCLTIGKKIRSTLPIKPGLPDLEHSIFQAGTQFFQFPYQIPILCIGASEINKKVIAFLRKKRFENITLCNRTASYAQEIAEKEKIHYGDWDLVHSWHKYDWIIFGTKSPSYLINRSQLPEHIGRKLIIDLSVPRNVDPRLGQNVNIDLLNIDHLNQTLKIRRKKLHQLVTLAEEMAIQAAKQKVLGFHLRHQRSLVYQAG